MATKQKGVAVVIENRPTFTGYINSDMPEQRKARVSGEIIGDAGLVVTRLWLDLTDEVTVKLVVDAPGSGTTVVLPEIGDTLTEAAADPLVTSAAVRKWSVEEVGRPRKSGEEMLLDLKLKRSEGCTIT